MDIAPGTDVDVRTHSTNSYDGFAATGVMKGYDFQVVWVCQAGGVAAVRAEGPRARCGPVVSYRTYQ
jgi:hypothetical protein